MNIGRQWGKIPRVPTGRNNYEIDIAAINLWRHYGVGNVEFGEPAFN
jgi:hypothetical protein